MALILRRSLAAGQLYRNLSSFALAPAATRSRSLCTAPSAFTFVESSLPDDHDAQSCEKAYKAASKLGWNRRGMLCQFDMPGLEKEQVKVWVDPERGAVVVRGEGPRRSESFDRLDVAAGRIYVGAVKPRPAISMSDVKAKMENGVLTILVRAEVKNPGPEVEFVKIN